jgi:hypothetical protein
MATFGRASKAKQWARLAMKLGLFLTDAKLWSSINDQLRERADDIGDVVRDTYEETSDRLENARAAIRGERHGISSFATFLIGIGVGVGAGMLLAPVSGEEARSAIRDKAMGMKNKAMDMTERGTGDYSTSSSRFRTGAAAPTGTTGD